MGNISGKTLKVNHKRTAGNDNAGTPIEEPSDWAMDFATYDESFAKVQELYESATDDEKTEMNNLCMDATGGIFTDRERMAAHFAGLNTEDF